MRYTVNTGQVISEIIDGEAVMINLTTGNYYSLNESGAFAWNAIERGASATDIVDMLASRFEGDRAEIERTTGALIEELTREELIVPTETDGAGTPALETTAAGRQPFSAPRLEKHTDMQDLILLDPVHEVGEQGWPHVKADDGAARTPDAVP